MTSPPTAEQETVLPAIPFPCDEKLRRKLRSRFVLNSYMLFKLPLARFAGLRIRDLSPHHCVCSIPYGWRSTNPFRSIYFAAQCMAAEMSTGALALLATRSAPGSVSMLVTGLEASFRKKASSESTFTCIEGHFLFDTVQQAIESGEGKRVTVESIGRDASGDEISRFTFEWSFKARGSVGSEATESR